MLHQIMLLGVDIVNRISRYIAVYLGGIASVHSNVTTSSLGVKTYLQ